MWAMFVAGCFGGNTLCVKSYKDHVEYDVRRFAEAYNGIAREEGLQRFETIATPAEIMERVTRLRKSVEASQNSILHRTAPYHDGEKDYAKKCALVCQVINENKHLLQHTQSAAILRTQCAMGRHALRYTYQDLDANDLIFDLDCFSNNPLTNIVWHLSQFEKTEIILQKTLLQCGATLVFKTHSNKDLWRYTKQKSDERAQYAPHFELTQRGVVEYVQRRVRILCNVIERGNVPAARLFLEHGEKNTLTNIATTVKLHCFMSCAVLIDTMVLERTTLQC